MVIFRDFKPFLCCTFEFLSSYVFGDNQHTMLVAAVAKIFAKSFFFSVCGELAALDILVEAGANASTEELLHESAQERQEEARLADVLADDPAHGCGY